MRCALRLARTGVAVIGSKVVGRIRRPGTVVPTRSAVPSCTAVIDARGGVSSPSTAWRFQTERVRVANHNVAPELREENPEVNRQERLAHTATTAAHHDDSAGACPIKGWKRRVPRRWRRQCIEKVRQGAKRRRKSWRAQTASLQSTDGGYFFRHRSKFHPDRCAYA